MLGAHIEATGGYRMVIERGEQGGKKLRGQQIVGNSNNNIHASA